jgi:hypothetical protein
MAGGRKIKTVNRVPIPPSYTDGISGNVDSIDFVLLFRACPNQADKPFFLPGWWTWRPLGWWRPENRYVSSSSGQSEISRTAGHARGTRPDSEPVTGGGGSIKLEARENRARLTDKIQAFPPKVNTFSGS